MLINQQVGSRTLAFDRQAIEKGHYWLLITGHFVHLNAIHLLLNMLGIGLVLALFDDLCSAWWWLVVLLVSALAISIMIYCFLPQVRLYVGLSGVIHSVYVVGALRLLRQTKERNTAILLMLLVTLKLLTENFGQGISLTADIIGGHVLVQAHLYGAIVGLFLSVMAFIANSLYAKMR